MDSKELKKQKNIKNLYTQTSKMLTTNLLPNKFASVQNIAYKYQIPFSG